MRRIGAAILTLAISAISLVQGCSDTSSPNAVFERWIYYASDSSSDGRQLPGLYRIACSDGNTLRIDPRPIVAISGIAANGVVLFARQSNQWDNGSDNPVLFGRCENGSIIPVPFPVSSSVDSEYVSVLSPIAALAYDGHHAAYPAYLKPVAKDGFEVFKARLVLFNCASGNMRVIDIEEGIKRLYRPESIRQVWIANDWLILSQDGAKIWFTASIELDGGAQVRRLLEWSDTLRMIGPPSESELSLVGYDDKNKILYTRRSGGLVHIPVSGNEFVTTGVTPAHVTPAQFSRASGEFAHVGFNGIEIRNAADASLERTVCTIDALNTRFQRLYEPARSRVVMSPDGEWLAFAGDITPGIGPENTCDILLMRRDGSELRRVAIGVRLSDIAISDRILWN
jgi:hypothetical protein